MDKQMKARASVAAAVAAVALGMTACASEAPGSPLEQAEPGRTSSTTEADDTGADDTGADEADGPTPETEETTTTEETATTEPTSRPEPPDRPGPSSDPEPSEPDTSADDNAPVDDPEQCLDLDCEITVTEGMEISADGQYGITLVTFPQVDPEFVQIVATGPGIQLQCGGSVPASCTLNGVDVNVTDVQGDTATVSFSP